jgi:hypothetical protein
LVSTKADLLKGEGMEETVIREGTAKAAEFNAKYFITSSLTGRNVFELFETAARETAVGNMEVSRRDGVQPKAPQVREDESCC